MAEASPSARAGSDEASTFSHLDMRVHEELKDAGEDAKDALNDAADAVEDEAESLKEKAN